MMDKQIPASRYTQPGDPLRIDCGYGNGMVRMFHAVSLETGVDDAKLLAFAAPALMEGVKKREAVDLLLTAITEPIGWPEGEEEPDVERKDRYDYVRNILELHHVRQMTSSDLAKLATTACQDLKI